MSAPEIARSAGITVNIGMASFAVGSGYSGATEALEVLPEVIDD